MFNAEDGLIWVSPHSAAYVVSYRADPEDTPTKIHVVRPTARAQQSLSQEPLGAILKTPASQPVKVRRQIVHIRVTVAHDHRLAAIDHKSAL